MLLGAHLVQTVDVQPLELFERECIELAHTGEGNRNNRLNEAAYSLARFVATGEANAGALVDLLTLAARHAGLGPHEIKLTIESAFGAHGVKL